jgi:aspartyl/asparaginyl-tRNA synthetase
MADSRDAASNTYRPCGCTQTALEREVIAEHNARKAQKAAQTAKTLGDYWKEEAQQPVKRPVVVMNYPKAIKAFYMRQNDDGRTVAAMDVLAPGIGEIIGGSQREERLERLDARMDEMGIDKESLGWYRDLRRYGSVPHAGFGLGFERTIAYVTGLSNVRDAIPFPRTPGNAKY